MHVFRLCQSYCSYHLTFAHKNSVILVNLSCKMYCLNSYEDAIKKLNTTLQSNKSTIEQIKKNIKNKVECTVLQDMEKYLSRIGITMSQLDHLSVIHVAGTKGKGTTSAMCESILRQYGFKTGFYSSPHLVAVRERIRLNGNLISKNMFSEVFHEVYNKLDSTKTFDSDMPKYFAFLTLMAYNVFIKEKVDVAIVEVGIGGVVDYTNVVRKVPVVGITSLGLDHTNILGNTLGEIAKAKAGIMKPGCTAFTVTQPPEAMEVLNEVATQFKCPLHIVPDFGLYKYDVQNSDILPYDNKAYCTNASLAIQLAHAWMRHYNYKLSIPKKSLKQTVNGHKTSNHYKLDVENNFIIRANDKNNRNNLDFVTNQNNLNESMIKILPSATINGLKRCKWPGRYQTVKTDYATFYLDGAHTKESMELCAEWFSNINKHENSYLIFSATGDRNAETLLTPMKAINFNKVYFVIPTANKDSGDKSDNNYSATEREEFFKRCNNCAHIWRSFHNVSKNTQVFECIADALNDIKSDQKLSSVLITGSLHLVGSALSIIDPNISE